MSAGRAPENNVGLVGITILTRCLPDLSGFYLAHTQFDDRTDPRRTEEKAKRKEMRFLHSMIRVYDVDAALRFFCDGLGLKEVRRRDSERGRFTLIFLETETASDSAQIELTHNWDETSAYSDGRNFGHLAFEVDDIYATCTNLMKMDVTMSRPPRDGRMAFVRSPDGISIELLQKGDALSLCEPWTRMQNIGSW